MLSSYFPHALYSVAITSISIHLVNHRRISNDERARITAHITILNSILQLMQSEKPPSSHELERMKRLARPIDTLLEAEPKEFIGWREVIFGRKTTENVPEISDWDRKDMKKVQRELEKQL